MRPIPRFRSLLLCSLFLSAGASLAPAQESVEVVSVELEGPLAGARLRAGERWTEISLRLEAGERRSLEVPFVAGWGEPVAEADPVGSGERGVARVLPGTRVSAVAWDSLPRGLRGRPRPIPSPRPPSPGAARWAWIVAALLLVLGLRRRPALALAGGGVAAAGIWLLPAPAPAVATITVLEADRASARALEVRGAIDSLTLPEARPGWIRCAPTAEGLHLVGTEQGGGVSWAFEAPGGRLVFARELPGGIEARLDSLRFARVWARRAGEEWRRREGWDPERGFEFEDQPGVPAPPGWLVSGLPQGIEVRLGEGVDRRGGAIWFRGF